MTLGAKGQRGRDGGRLFDRPTDIDCCPTAPFSSATANGGTRVAKFDKDGKFLMDWGTPPKDPKNPGLGEFNTKHSIQISKDGRLFVVDRGHRRVQVFDQNGKFLDRWTTGVRSSPYAHLITADQFLWISDGGTNRILKYDLNGKFLYGWGGPGGQPGAIQRAAFDHDRPGTAISTSRRCSTAACRSSDRSRVRIPRRSSDENAATGRRRRQTSERVCLRRSR